MAHRKEFTIEYQGYEFRIVAHWHEDEYWKISMIHFLDRDITALLRLDFVEAIRIQINE